MNNNCILDVHYLEIGVINNFLENGQKSSMVTVSKQVGNLRECCNVCITVE